jgi:predicted  nucleic acid-binding Zn-ribbon protein
LGARISDWSRARGDAIKREGDHEAVQLTYDQAQMNTLTERFRTLMDGYERRINDLIMEVKDLRERLSVAESKLKEVHNASNAAT